MYWTYNERIGRRSFVPMNFKLAFYKTLLCCCKATVQLADSEREWVLGLCSATGGDDLIPFLEDYDANDDPAALLTNVPGLSEAANELIYNAISACSSDKTFDEQERQSVLEIAQSIGVNRERFLAIEALYNEEAELRKRRIRLLSSLKQES